MVPGNGHCLCEDSCDSLNVPAIKKLRHCQQSLSPSIFAEKETHVVSNIVLGKPSNPESRGGDRQVDSNPASSSSLSDSSLASSVFHGRTFPRLYSTCDRAQTCIGTTTAALTTVKRKTSHSNVECGCDLDVLPVLPQSGIVILRKSKPTSESYTAVRQTCGPISTTSRRLQFRCTHACYC